MLGQGSVSVSVYNHKSLGSLLVLQGAGPWLVLAWCPQNDGTVWPEHLQL